MADDITDKELKLAERVNDLSDAAARPVVAGGGLLAAATNFLMRRVSRGIMTAALTVFIAYQGWEAFNGSLQAMADLQIKRAEAGQMAAEAIAINDKTGNSSLILKNMEAELDKLQQQAAAASADADAQNAIIGDASMKLQTLRANLDKTQQEARSAKALADALTQKIDGMPAAVAQKKAEVETAEAEAVAEIQRHRLMVSQGLQISQGIGAMMNDALSR
jgi:hypothetical protein